VVRSTSFGVKSELEGVKRVEFGGYQGKSIFGARRAITLHCSKQRKIRLGELYALILWL